MQRSSRRTRPRNLWSWASRHTAPAAKTESLNSPDTPAVWHEIDPFEEIWPEDPEEPKYGELPMTLGPAKSSGRKPPFFGTIDPHTGRCSGEVLDLVKVLNWKVG